MQSCPRGITDSNDTLHLAPYLSATANVMLPLAIVKTHGKDKQAMAEEALS